jgi:FixJ family two-component response regulator
VTEAVPIVHVVDDDESFRRAAARLLKAGGFQVRTYASGEAFLDESAQGPGCVVTDLAMPGLGGLELQRAVTASANPLPILILTGHGDVASTKQAIRGGADDYLEKTGPPGELLEAVRRAVAHDMQLRQARARRDALVAAFATLTEREREVLRDVVRGRLNKQIAADLALHERTVKLHRQTLMGKLGVRSVAELTLLAQEAGWLEPPHLATPR